MNMKDIGSSLRSFHKETAKIQEYLTEARGITGWNQGQEEMMECGIRWAFEAERKGKSREQK